MSGQTQNSTASSSDRAAAENVLRDLQNALANNFEELAPNEWSALTAMIEQGLTSDGDDVGTAVATGLIEGLIHRAEVIDNLWPRIEAGLGSEARSYADAYRNAEWAQ